MTTLLLRSVVILVILFSAAFDFVSAQSDPCSLPAVIASFEAAALSNNVDEWETNYTESTCTEAVKNSVKVMAQGYRIFIGEEIGPQVIPGSFFDCVTASNLTNKANYFETNALLPVSWEVTQGGEVYWQAYMRIQDEKTVHIIIRNAGDDAGNRALDRIRIFDPTGILLLDQKNREGDPTFDINTTEPGYYCILFEDNDTNGNGGDLIIEGINDQTLYRNPE